MFHASRTLKNGASATLRQVLDTTVAGWPVANGAPTKSSDQMVPRGMWQNIDAIAFTAVDKFDVGFWWWYESAQLWVLDTSLGTAGYTTIDGSKGVARIAILDNNKSICADGLYVEVKSLVGGASPKVWLQGQQ